MKESYKKAKEKRKILDIQSLCFETDKKVLDNVNWTVLEGERWVLLGANGAGKTSLLSTVCAYNTPSSGSMCVNGKTYENYDWQKVRQKIALVGSQIKRNIAASESVLDVVISGKFAQINYWGKVTKALVAEAMAKLRSVGLARIADSQWSYISQGERQKVLLARALMLKPSIVFLDEPCAGLDPVARKKFVNFLDKLSARKDIPAIVMATHYVEEIPPSFTRAIAIKRGRVLACGDIRAVMDSDFLSNLYGAKCVLKKNAGRYSLRVM